MVDDSIQGYVVKEDDTQAYESIFLKFRVRVLLGQIQPLFFHLSQICRLEKVFRWRWTEGYHTNMYFER